VEDKKIMINIDVTFDLTHIRMKRKDPSTIYLETEEKSVLGGALH